MAPNFGSQTGPATGATRPWGRLNSVKFPMYRPQEAFAGETSGLAGLRWSFQAGGMPEVLAMLDRAGVTNRSEMILRDTNRWTRTASGYALHPPAEVVEHLAPDTRARLYSLLGHWAENPYHRAPLRLATGALGGFTAGLHLAPAKIELFKSLAYEDQDTICFADLPLLLNHTTPAEARSVLRETSRIAALLLELWIEPGADVEPLVRYWGPGRHASVIRPLLESLAALPRGGKIDVSHLLPPFARLRLFTYGDPAMRGVSREDCFWTGMNFFNDPPDDQFKAWSKTAEVLRTQYRRVPREEWAFGDALIVADGMETVHMCVYVADDVVFTKNGVNAWQPWVFMQLDDMLATYPPEKTRTILAYRRLAP